MAVTVPIRIFRIAKTQVDRDEVTRWLAFLGVEGFALPDDETVSNPALLIAMAAKRCYKSFTVDTKQNPNISRVRTDWAEYLDNILKSGHGSVFEHAVFSFAIENVSRVFTAEMNRHRAGWAISEGSMRFIRFSESVPYWEPPSIQGPDVLSDIQASVIREEAYPGLAFHLRRTDKTNPPPLLTLDEKKHASRILFERSFEAQAEWYACLEEIWKEELAPESKFQNKKEITSMMRRGIGMGCATGGVWTGNARALRHVLTMRCEPAAEEEILHVFSRIAKMMVADEPMLFGDFSQDAAGTWRPLYKKV